MNIKQQLEARSESKCELCGAGENLEAYIVPPKSGDDAEECVLACATCLDQLQSPENADPNHWRCLNDSMWNPEPAVQVVVWRMLKSLSAESWTQDLLNTMYMEEETQKWAMALEEAEANKVVHKDANGAILQAGDTVVVIKDLNVKGSSLVAKRGTAVRRISLVQDNPEHIEGRVEGQHIVLLTKFVKKSK